MIVAFPGRICSAKAPNAVIHELMHNVENVLYNIMFYIILISRGNYERCLKTNSLQAQPLSLKTISC